MIILIIWFVSAIVIKIIVDRNNKRKIIEEVNNKIQDMIDRDYQKKYNLYQEEKIKYYENKFKDMQ